MDDIIERLLEIEAASQKILDGADIEIKDLDEKQAERVAAFTQQIEKETEDRKVAMHEKLVAEIKTELAAQKAAAQSLEEKMNQAYAEKHEAMAEALFQKIIRK